MSSRQVTAASPDQPDGRRLLLIMIGFRIYAVTQLCLPASLIAGYVVSSVIAGALTSAIGYYNPEMIVGWIVGYQILYGFGVGFGFGQPSYVAQTVLAPNDVPIGVTLITLLQNLSASIFVAVAQSISQGELRQRLSQASPEGDLPDISGLGAGDFLSLFPPAEQPMARQYYSTSLLLTLYVSLSLSAASSIGAICTRWGSMKANVKNDVAIPEKQQTGHHSGSEDLRPGDIIAVPVPE